MNHNLPPQAPQGPAQGPERPLAYDDEALQQMFRNSEGKEGEQHQPVQSPEGPLTGIAGVETSFDDLNDGQQVSPPRYHSKVSGRSDLGPSANDLRSGPQQ